jgi:hypothetical protein
LVRPWMLGVSAADQRQCAACARLPLTPCPCCCSCIGPVQLTDAFVQTPDAQKVEPEWWALLPVTWVAGWNQLDNMRGKPHEHAKLTQVVDQAVNVHFFTSGWKVGAGHKDEESIGAKVRIARCPVTKCGKPAAGAPVFTELSAALPPGWQGMSPRTAHVLGKPALCGIALMGVPMHLECPPGSVIAGIPFASFGRTHVLVRNREHCASYRPHPQCHFEMRDLVAHRCRDKRVCVLGHLSPRGRKVFDKHDPCPGASKSFAVVVQCNKVEQSKI